MPESATAEARRIKELEGQVRDLRRENGYLKRCLLRYRRMARRATWR